MPAKTPVRKRRTQEERTTETRGKIIRGAAKCIVEKGYKATTMKAIAEAAGITWGAIQHHFGDKESILKGITDLGGREFNERVHQIDPAGMTIPERVDAFLARARKQIEDELYLASVVILRNKPERLTLSDYHSMQEVLRESWDYVFGDLKKQRKRLAYIRDFTFMAINAIAMERMAYEASDRYSPHHFKLLNEFLVSSLGDGGTLGEVG